MRLALRIDDLFELAQHPHAGEQLGEAAVRLALLLDGGDELPVLQFDAVHRDVDLGDVDRLVLAVEQVIIAGEKRPVVADVAEEAAQRTVIVERQRQRQDREFFAAIQGKREPNASLAQVYPAMQTLDRLEKSLG